MNRCHLASLQAVNATAPEPVYSSVWNATRFFGLALALGCLTGCVQGAFYHPDRGLYDTRARLGLKYEQVTFASQDGTRLVGWFIPARGYADPKRAKGTVVHFHGNAQNLSAHWQFVDWLPQRGFNLFVFDYRGYGASQGSPEPKGVFEDSLAALDYVRARPDVDPERLLALGQSLGGTNAIAAVGSGNRAGVRAIAIESTFFSYSAIASDKLVGAGSLVDDTYSADRFVGALAPMPLLLLHGTADAVIPYSHSERLYAKAGEPKRLVRIEGGAHAEAFTPRFGRCIASSWSTSSTPPWRCRSAAAAGLRRSRAVLRNLVRLVGRSGGEELRSRGMQHDESIRIDSPGVPGPRDDHGRVLAQTFSDRRSCQRPEHEGGGEPL